MGKKKIFFGSATALITPFKDGDIDYEALSRLIDFQISNGSDALVVAGTTGEAATLSDKERYTLYSYARERCAGRIKLILGTGTNDTRAALAHTKFAEGLGCDGVLLVTPYYNKGTNDGITRHYLTILESCSIPAIIYNVPSRTGVNLDLGIVERLAEHENAVGIKEASDSADRLVSLAALKDKLPLYAGNDTQIYTCLSLGGYGVISVVSNVVPRRIAKMCHDYASGMREESLSEQLKLLPLIRAVFKETNPAPIKYILANTANRFGTPKISEELRLPLSKVSEATRDYMDAVISQY